MLFGLDFWSSFSVIFQSWFLSKKLNICLRFFGIFFKWWFTMLCSLNVIYLLSLISKASKNLVVTSSLLSSLIFFSWESSSIPDTHPEIELRTNFINKNLPIFGDNSLARSSTSAFFANRLKAFLIFFPSYLGHGLKALISFAVMT